MVQIKYWWILLQVGFWLEKSGGSKKQRDKSAYNKLNHLGVWYKGDRFQWEIEANNLIFLSGRRDDAQTAVEYSAAVIDPPAKYRLFPPYSRPRILASRLCDSFGDEEKKNQIEMSVSDLILRFSNIFIYHSSRIKRTNDPQHCFRFLALPAFIAKSLGVVKGSWYVIFCQTRIR